MSWLLISQLGNGLSVLLAMICFIIIALQQPSAEQRLAVIYVVFSIVSCFGYMGLAFSQGNLNTLILATKLKYLGSLVLGLVFLLTTRYLKIKLPVVFHVIVCISVLFMVIIIFFFDAPETVTFDNPVSWGNFCRTWLFKNYEAAWSQGIPYLKKTNSWGHLVYILLSITYAVVLSIQYVKIFIKRSRTDIENLVTLYFIIMIPNLSYLLDKVLAKIFGPALPLQMVPIGMVISDFLFAYLIIIRKFCDVNDLASNQFFDIMATPAFVIDANNILVNLNQTAKKYFPEVTKNLIGKDVYSNLPKQLSCICDELMRVTSKDTGLEPVDSSDDNLIFCQDESERERYFQPKIYIIENGKKFQGYIVWLEDVTVLKKESSDKIQSMRDKMILGFSSLAENHDFSTQGHLHRTAAYARAIAQELYEQGRYKDQINPKFIDTIEQVAPLHDIGKTYIDKEIFNKPGKLNEEELKIMHQHTTLGAEFLRETLKDNQDSLYVKMAIDIALHHHEWWNGKGYPDGLKENEIPLSARIMAIADTFDALVTVRPYKRSFTCDEAFDIIQNESGTHFEPGIVLCFLSIADKVKMIKAKVEMEDMAMEEVNDDDNLEELEVAEEPKD